MPGYKVDLYKYMRIDENLKKSQKLLQKRYCVVDENKQNREPDCTFLAFGEFDRIGFEKIERFSRYRDVSLSARTWIGDRQTLLAYEIDGDYSIKYDDGNFFYKVSEGNNVWKQSEHLFVGMTIFQFKYSQKKISDDNRGEYLKNCKKNIMGLLQESGLDILCNVLGILGSFGLIVICLADQYAEILELITRIRSRDIGRNVCEDECGVPANSIFLSAYTIFAQNHEYGAGWHSKIHNVKGETILQMTLKKGLDVNVFQSFFSGNGIKKIVLHSAGEYDLIAKMKSSDSFGICEMEKDLHYGKDLFKTYILQTNMQLCEEKNLADHCDAKISDCAESENQEDSLQDLEKIQDLCKKIREDYAETFPPTAGMIDTLDLLYNDYISKISTASNEMWVQDFSYQFCSILQCIKKLMDEIHETKCNILDVIHHLLQYFERQISHIAESNNLTLGTPTCQFRYSGQNNLTLYAYFGIIKHIIEHIYMLQEVNMQSEIIPMIVVDNTPLIKSEIYYVNDIKNDPRILTIHMPMTALYFPIAYYPYLYHELFHYVVPKDRYMRNRIIGCLISSEVLLSILKQIFEGVFEKERNQTEWLMEFLIECVLPHIYSFVLKNYFLFEQNERDLTTIEISNQEMDQRSDVSAGYEDHLFRKWMDWCNEECDVALKKNPVFGFLVYIHERIDQLKKDAVEWQKGRQQDLSDNFENEIEMFHKQLEGIVKNPVSETQDKNYNRLMRYMTETPFNVAMVFNDCIREALADIAMVIMTGMDFSQYLLMYTRIRKDLKISDAEKNRMYSQDNIRIGLVCDYLYRNYGNRDCHMGRIMQMKESYVNMYCGLYYCAGRKDTDDGYVAGLKAEADQWFSLFENFYKRYRIRYHIYEPVIQQLIHLSIADMHTDMTVDISRDKKYWNHYVDKLKEYGMTIAGQTAGFAEQYHMINEALFHENIMFVHEYQKQPDFRELDQIRRQIWEKKSVRSYKSEICWEKIIQKSQYTFVSEESVKPNKNVIWEYYADSVGRLVTLIADIANELRRSAAQILGDINQPVWYRGQQSKDFVLLPNIMRNYNQWSKKFKNEKITLMRAVRKSFEEFRYLADGMTDIIERPGYTYSDYIALMQHYQADTPFLDWTEDALSALYFALEEYFDPKVLNLGKDSTLYIFSPALYNYARYMMLEEGKNDSHRTEIESDVYENRALGIPNLSVSYNQEKNYMFLLGKNGKENERAIR